MNVCPFKKSHLTLLGCFCVDVAGQTIANIVADTPGLSEIQRIRRRLKGILHSRSDINRTGAEGLSFYYPRLLHCLDQMLAVMSLSQHRVSSFKTIRRIDMCLQRLSQRFGLRGGFFGEPEIRKYRYGTKLPWASAFALKEFKDQLSQCLLYAGAYNQSDKFEGWFVTDLAKRLLFSTVLGRNF